MGQLGQTTVPLRTLGNWGRRAAVILTKAEQLRNEILRAGQSDDFSDRADNICVEAEDMVNLIMREKAARRAAREQA